MISSYAFPFDVLLENITWFSLLDREALYHSDSVQQLQIF